MTTSPAVTLVVITYNSAAELPECLESLPAALEGVPSYEVVIVDNASTDETTALVSDRYQLLRLDRNLGYSAAINRGLAAVPPSQAALVLNPDIRLAPGSVRRLLDGLAPGIGITVPRLFDASGRTAPSLRREPTPSRAALAALIGGTRAGRIARWGELIYEPSVYEHPTEAAWASGAAMLISRACLDAVGPWDESFFLYAEEIDFAFRARDAGFSLCYVPSAHAVHLGGASHVDADLWSLSTLNHLRFFARRNGRARTLAFRAALILNELLRAVGGSGTHRAALGGLLAAPTSGLRDPTMDSRHLLARWRARMANEPAPQT